MNVFQYDYKFYDRKTEHSYTTDEILSDGELYDRLKTEEPELDLLIYAINRINQL